MPGYAVWFGSLAQLVEQRTFNPLVAGSNPARPTNKSISYSNFPEPIVKVVPSPSAGDVRG